jgi:uncharacterized membrane protein YfcA
MSASLVTIVGDAAAQLSLSDGSAAVLGAVVGIVVGLTSMGGGALLTPGLIFLGIPPSLAIGSDVLIASVTKLFGSGAYLLKREVHWPTVGRLALGSIPGALVGNRILNALPRSTIDSFVIYGLGFVLIVAGTITLLRLRSQAPLLDLDTAMPPMVVIALMGFITGLLVTVTSVGSGSILIIMMMRSVPLPMKKLVGSDIVHALILSSVATFLHARAGRVDVHLALSVLIGAVPGVLVGARMAGVLPERSLRGAVAGTLVFVGSVLLARGPSKPHPTPVAAATSSMTATMNAPVIAAEIHQ